MKAAKHLLILILIVLIKPALAQQNLTVALEDKVVLTGDTYRGTIQWQSSNDGIEWSDYRGGSLNGLEVIIGQQLTYYRAKIEEEGCEIAHYSEEIEVESNKYSKCRCQTASCCCPAVRPLSFAF